MTWSDVTVWQWQQIQILSDKKESLKEEDLILETVLILVNKTKTEILKLSKRNLEKIVKQIEFLYLNEPKIKSVEFIKIKRKKYKCEYNVKDDKAGRYIEIKYFTSDFKNNLHKICASMITPMKPSIFGWKLDIYNSELHEEYAQEILSAPFEQVFGSVIQRMTLTKNLDSNYKGLFNQENKEETNHIDTGNQFLKYFGWIYQAKLVGEHEGIKLEDVYSMPTISFLNDLSYLTSKASYEAEQKKKANAKY